MKWLVILLIVMIFVSKIPSTFQPLVYKYAEVCILVHGNNALITIKNTNGYKTATCDKKK